MVGLALVIRGLPTRLRKTGAVTCPVGMNRSTRKVGTTSLSRLDTHLPSHTHARANPHTRAR